MDPSGLLPFGRALRAFHQGDVEAVLDLRWDPGEAASVPVATFFAPPGRGTYVEVAALQRAKGRVIDVGAGSGRFGLAIQARGQPVLGLDTLADAVAVMRARGLDARRGRVEDCAGAGADTVLVMMNGTTLAGSLAGLAPFLHSLKTGMTAHGRILIDSTDPDHPAVEWEAPGDGRAAGELHLQMGFRGSWGAPLPQLFVGSQVLATEARRVGLVLEVVAEDPDGRYLAELTQARG
ncbi:MAG: hypothetical protein HKN73_04330 [Gemmatimonadetes bacterium]|nr:hypothetical protein [Gemmatimonadota bacterium]